MSWFDVDKAGLAAILERRGKTFAVAELISNAWDSGSDRVEVTLQPLHGQPLALLVVEDWGEGFADLKDSYTMFGRSRRSGEAGKRGRFNLGEKLVLAVCRGAEIVSTGGGIQFSEGPGGGRVNLKTTRPRGTKFTANVRMTRSEYEEVCAFIGRLVPPVATSFNGQAVVTPPPIRRFNAKLPTELADSDGLLRRSTSTAAVEVYPGEDGRGEILELGVPVVETDNGYRVNVLQKVPLNMDRDNVTPAFLKAVQAALLNNVANDLNPEQAAAPWAQEAAGDARATPEAVKAVITKRFGDRAVVATPGDPLANANAEAAGFTVIPGGAMSADAWANVRKHNLLLPSGQVFPSPKPDQVAAQAAGKCPLCGK